MLNYTNLNKRITRKDMNKQLMPKVVLIIVLIVLAGLALYPPSQKLKLGIDLNGGVSLIYQIDTFGLGEDEKRDLSSKMITVLQRRIDPANIQNLIWLPQGNSRFEIQIPLASADVQKKRAEYEAAEKKLLAKNISRAKVIQALSKPKAERTELFNAYSQGDPNRLPMLENLAELYDKRAELQNSRDSLTKERDTAANAVKSAGMNLDQVKSEVVNLVKLDPNELAKSLKKFTDANDNIPVLVGYVKAYSQWAKVVDDLTELNPKYTEAINAVDNLNLTQEQLNLCLEMPIKSQNRIEKIAQLKKEFPDRVAEIAAVVYAYDTYSPDRGRLDDPKDLQRMLKGAGILEFRILPTLNPDYGLDADAMNTYVERLKEKGPQYASDNDYKWCEIENKDEWGAADKKGYPAIVAQFGSKDYVLTSNKTDETILHVIGQEDWKLERSFPTTDSIGRRAIGLYFDIKGGKFFSIVTGKNIDKPLCILLDNIAISAPNIESRIGSEGVITGSFTETQVQDMVNKLNAGSLPARLIEQPISVNTIGPSIGEGNRDQGIKSGYYGFIAVVAVMTIYYAAAGGIADVALLLNLLFILAIMAAIRATFTLPGIAGFILTIGMSVDANVLIYERIREEQERGSSLRVAIANGYQKAFSTIFDSNLTTVITAVILYWKASEEVKGFAIVLILGILSSMFTALFVTRVIFDFLLNKRIIKDHLFMLRIIHSPNINWMKLRPVFLTISGILMVSGLFVFFSRDNSKYDIEFTGGTNATIKLAKGVNLSQQDVQNMIRVKLPAANVYGIGESGQEFEITTTETNKITAVISSNEFSSQSAEQIKSVIENTQKSISTHLTGLNVTKESANADKVSVSTSQMNQSAVKEILKQAFPQAELSPLQVDELVNDAILETFSGKLEIQENLHPTIMSEEKIDTAMIEAHPELADFLGGIKLTCSIETEDSIKEIEQRITNLQFKPDTRDLKRYDYEILSSSLAPVADVNKPVNEFVYVSSDPEASIRQFSDDEWESFVKNEKTKIISATEQESTLPRVRQFDPSVGSEQKRNTMIAIVLSLFSIIAYIWIRFGNLRYGLGAIVSLIHDTCITLGAITACTYIAGTAIGKFFLIEDFKINLTIIAAILTLIGYSLNDTIVVFDRIRENRGKAKKLNPQLITDSINQTISRTIMTSLTTFVVILVMYIFGGSGMRGFSFSIGFGIIIGTYSSIAIAAPILLIGAKSEKEKDIVEK
jgi:SecD/SecF fusion protein